MIVNHLTVVYLSGREAQVGAEGLPFTRRDFLDHMVTQLQFSGLGFWSMCTMVCVFVCVQSVQMCRREA